LALHPFKFTHVVNLGRKPTAVKFGTNPRRAGGFCEFEPHHFPPPARTATNPERVTSRRTTAKMLSNRRMICGKAKVSASFVSSAAHSGPLISFFKRTKLNQNGIYIHQR
jgi:hypothetical protein